MTDREAMKMAFEIIGVLKPENIEHKHLQGAAWDALRQALAQLDSTSDSATRSADSAESFCKQELHNLMSVAGRMALELECLLLDTKDLSVVSEWWDTGMESLQAYRDYIWSITHGKEQIIALAQPEPPVCCGDYEKCMKACTPRGRWLAENELAQPEQEPVAKHVCNLWINPETSEYEVDRCTHPINEVIPVYTAPPRKEWVGLTDEERNEMIGKIQHDQFTRQRDLIGKTQIITEMYLKERNT